MPKLTDVDSTIRLTVGGNRTHCLDLSPVLNDGQTVASVVSVTEEDGSLLNIGTPEVLTSTFLNASARNGPASVEAGKGVKVNIEAVSAGDTYILWKVTLSGGDDPVFRQAVQVS